MGSDDRVAYAIIFPTYHAGSEGIVAACCTKRANLMQRDHKRGSIAIIDTPAWLYYDCYFFPGMTLLNWSGMTDATYNRCLHIGLLGDYLNAQFQSHGIVELKDAYCVATRGEPYFKGLRDLLGRLGVQVWLELVSRCSVRVCGALDVSVRMFAGSYVEAQDLSISCGNGVFRKLPQPRIPNRGFHSLGIGINSLYGNLWGSSPSLSTSPYVRMTKTVSRWKSSLPNALMTSISRRMRLEYQQPER